MQVQSCCLLGLRSLVELVSGSLGAGPALLFARSAFLGRACVRFTRCRSRRNRVARERRGHARQCHLALLRGWRACRSGPAPRFAPLVMPPRASCCRCMRNRVVTVMCISCSPARPARLERDRTPPVLRASWPCTGAAWARSAVSPRISPRLARLPFRACAAFCATCCRASCCRCMRNRVVKCSPVVVRGHPG